MLLNEILKKQNTFVCGVGSVGDTHQWLREQQLPFTLISTVHKYMGVHLTHRLLVSVGTVLWYIPPLPYAQY